MSLVRWNDSYATGIARIDDQHRTLFGAVNDLHDAFRTGAAKAQIGKAIDFLVTYTVEHFRDEEGYMERYGYDGLAAHRAEHQLLLDQVQEFNGKFRTSPDSVRPMEVARFLGDWLTHHIPTFDKAYAGPMRAGGIH